MKALLSLCLVACHPFWGVAVAPVNSVTPQPPPTTPIQFTNRSVHTIFSVTINGSYCWVEDKPPYPIAPGGRILINVGRLAGCKIASPHPWSVTYSAAGARQSCTTSVSYLGDTSLRPYAIATADSGLICSRAVWNVNGTSIVITGP